MKPIYRAYLDLSSAMIIVGSSVVIGKIITEQFPIFMALMIRFAVALPLLILFSYRKHTIYIPSQRILTQVFLQALTGVFLFNVLLLIGLRFTSASQSGLITSVTPAIIAILGWFFLHERLSRYEWGGVLLCVAGVVVINMIGSVDTVNLNINSLIGNLFVLGAVTCEALFTIFRKTSKDLSAIVGAMWVTLFGLLLCLPFGIYQMLHFDLSSITLEQIGVLLYYGVFVSAVAYVLWFRGLDVAPVSVAGVLSGVLPISVIVLSALFLGEPITVYHLIGLGLVIGGIVLMALTSSRTT